MIVSATTSSESLQRTPLYPLHHTAGARFVPFSGWTMPVQYQGLKQEHEAVRQRAGIFDISHMGKWILRGPELRSKLAALVPTDLSSLAAGEAQYTVLLNADAGILDDIILYNQGSAPDQPTWERWTVIVNAATSAQDQAWLRQHLAQVDLQDLGGSHLLLALQGPQSVAYLQPLVQDDLTQLKRFQHQLVTVQSPDPQPVFIARTGYTGEDGFEIMPPIATGEWIWQELIKAGVEPCGLGARDTLRLEAAMHLYGQDMDLQTTPLEAGLQWLITSAADYIGRSALTEQQAKGLSRKLVGLRMQGREIARQGYPIYAQDQAVGIVTSGTKSPTLGYSIALGYVPPDLAKLGSEVEIEIRGKRYPAAVVKRPFYRSPAPAPR